MRGRVVRAVSSSMRRISSRLGVSSGGPVREVEGKTPRDVLERAIGIEPVALCPKIPVFPVIYQANTGINIRHFAACRGHYVVVTTPSW